jgi:hypothetical protein
MRAVILILLTACSDTAGSKPVTTEGNPFASGVELRVTVPDSGRAYVKLSPPAVVSITGDPRASAEWDLAFEGRHVYTNSGASGGGQAGSFGPLEAAAFTQSTAPQVPFVSPDKPGGPFLDWYVYEGAPSHALWSRFHVFGVRDGERLYKVQILSYYGERNGAPVAGIYRVRYAKLGGEVQEAADLDGTAGGRGGAPDAPSACLDLATGARAMLSPAAARSSRAWHLCFRRQAVSVNGGIGGPREIGAVDVHAGEAETIDVVRSRTPESERARFDAVTVTDLEGKRFEGDRIVSGFGDGWSSGQAAWLVVDALGKNKFLVGFSEARTPGPIVMWIKPVRE